MKTFSKWLLEHDPEMYTEVDWRKMARNAALAGALMSPFAAAGTTQQQNVPRPFDVQHQSMRGDTKAAQQYGVDRGSSRINMSPTEVKSFTKLIEQSMGPNSVIEIIQTQNTEEGLLIILGYSGQIIANSQEEANQKAQERLMQIASKQGFSIQNTQVLGEQANVSVRMRITILIPH